MADLTLSPEEAQALEGVIEKVKASKAYQNYLAGVGLNLKRASSLKGEGDAFAKIGEALRRENVPSYLNATLKGQQKVQTALLAELKQQKLQGLLKNEELNEAVYRDLYVEPGTLNKFLGISPQEENMSDNANDQTQPTNEDNREELLDRPEYEGAFYEIEGVKDLNLGEKITKEQAAKLEKMYQEYLEAQKNEGAGNDEGGQGNDTGAANEEEGQGGDSDNPEATNEEEGQGDDGNDSGAANEEEGQGSKPVVEIDGAGDETARTSENEDPEWVKQYDKALKEYGAANSNEWVRDNQPDENGLRPAGLKGRFANGTEAHYVDKDKLSVKTPEGQEPQADHFKEIVALAKDNGQEIKLGTSMSPAFKAALIEACAKGEVSIQGMSEEEQKIYDEFKTKPQEKTGNEEDKKEFELSPVIAKGRLGHFARDLKTAVADDTDDFDNDIRNKKEKLQQGGLNAYDEGKLKAEILMAKFVAAEYEGDKETQALCMTALQRYGLDSIRREPEKGGSFITAGKPFAERTEEEKGKINAAMEKAFPKKQELDPAVRQAMAERQSQTLN